MDVFKVVHVLLHLLAYDSMGTKIIYSYETFKWG